jgi:hypothetical protein
MKFYIRISFSLVLGVVIYPTPKTTITNKQKEALQKTHLRTWDSLGGGGQILLSSITIGTAYLVLKKLTNDIETNTIQEYPKSLFKLIDQNRKIIYSSAEWIRTFLPTTAYFSIRQYIKKKEQNTQNKELITVISDAERELPIKDHTGLTFNQGVPFHQHFPQFIFQRLNEWHRLQDFFTNNPMISFSENKKNKESYQAIEKSFDQLIKHFNNNTDHNNNNYNKDVVNIFNTYKKLIQKIETQLQKKLVIMTLFKNHIVLIPTSIILCLLCFYIKKYIELHGIDRKTPLIKFLRQLLPQHDAFAKSIINQVYPIYCFSTALLYVSPLYTLSLLTFEYYQDLLKKKGLINQTKILYETTPQAYFTDKSYIKDIKNQSDQNISDITELINNDHILALKALTLALRMKLGKI